MRKNMLMLLAAALLVVTGCKKDNKTENNGEKMIFTATIDNGGSKTQINGFDQVWNTGDKVNINGEEFTVTPKAGDPSWATFEGQTVTPDEGDMYKAIFPNSYYVSEGLYNFPATQTYNGNNLSGVNPLYAESTTQELVFHNICALMKLNLIGNGTDKVTEIKVSADQALSGNFEVKERGEGYFAELVTSGGSADVTLNCGDGVALTEEGTAFYIAIPEYDDYSNLTFTATTSEGKTWTYKANGGNNIAILANNLYESTQTPEFVSPAPTAPTGALSRLFTVSAGEDGEDGTDDDVKVWFSKGNLQYVKSSSTWQFAANQYETVESNEQDVGEDYANQGIVGLFGWGTSGWNNGNNYYQPFNTHYMGDDDEDLDPGDSENPYRQVGLGYGPIKDDHGGFNLTNNDEYEFAEADWGVHNAIDNGGNEAGIWRTLSGDEWYYLCDIDGDHEARRDKYKENVTVNGVKGFLIAPDDWKLTDYPLQDEYNGTSSPLTWEAAEAAGLVFLPAAGYRQGTIVWDVNEEGYYWSSSINEYQPENADIFYFADGGSSGVGQHYCFRGAAVRLVSDVKN